MASDSIKKNFCSFNKKYSQSLDALKKSSPDCGVGSPQMHVWLNELLVYKQQCETWAQLNRSIHLRDQQVCHRCSQIYTDSSNLTLKTGKYKQPDRFELEE